MRFQKTIKRMIALGTGATMLGATMAAGVFAADLSSYPSPFIKDGKFNGVMVVGDKAAAEDVIGVTDIATSLQAAAVKKVSSAAGSLSVEGDAWLVRTSNKLELSEALSTGTSLETIRNVTTFIDSGDLKALANGEITNNKVTAPYKQYLYLLGPGADTSMDSGYVLYTEDDADTTADFLYFKSSREIGRYLLEFTTQFESDVDDSAGSTSSTGLFLTDFQDVDIPLFGKTYSIVTAKRVTTRGSDVLLTLMGGAKKDTLIEGNTKTYNIGGKDYEVTLNFVDADEAQFVVNGQSTRKMKDGDTDKLTDGTTVGVTDVLYQDYAGGIHSATFFVGAQKLELKDTLITDTASSNALKVDDNEIDDAVVIIEGSDTNSTFKISRIHVNMTADDNFYIPAGGKLSANPDLDEPQVLFTNNWDVEYKGLSKEASEEVRLKTSGNTEYQLEFVDGDGHKVNVPIAKVGSTATALLYGDSGKPFINTETVNSSVIVKDSYLVITDGSRKRGERKTYILQYKGADKSTADSPKIKFKDLGSGDTVEVAYSLGGSIVGGPGAHSDLWQVGTLKLGGADHNVYNASTTSSNDYNIVVDLDASGSITSGNGTAYNPVVITTRYGLEINVTNMTAPESGILGTSSGIIVKFVTPDESKDTNAKDSVDKQYASDLVINISAASSKVQHSLLTAHSPNQKGTVLNLRTPESETNIAYGYTHYGTFITRETPTNDPATIKLDVPQNQRLPLVYITGKGASFSETAAGSGDAVTVQRIEVGATKLASEVSNINSVNSIIVGGPCANAAAASVMGNPADCTAGFEPGVGKINVYDVGTGATKDNVAMVIAGYAALDTRNAAQVVANYKDYKSQLKGGSVEVRKVGSQVTVAAPVAKKAVVAETTTTTTTE